MGTYLKSISTIMLAAVVLVGCGSSDGDRVPPASEQNISLNLFADPPSLDPRQFSDATSVIVMKMLFEGLTRIGPDGEPALATAKEVQVSADLQTYIFRLRESSWTNGDRVTAHDFVAAWKKTLSPDFLSHGATQLYNLKNGLRIKKDELNVDALGVYAPDDHTLIVTLEHPNPYFLSMVANPEFFPINQRVARANPDWAKSSEGYVSNGPFSLVNRELNVSLQLKKNQTYWDASTVQLASITLLVTTDAENELELYNQGKIDWVGGTLSRISSRRLPELLSDDTLQSAPIAGTYLFLYNTRIPPFDNTKIRKALAYVINRHSLVRDVVRGDQEIALRLVPSVLSDDTYHYFSDYDIKRARSLFDRGLSEVGMTQYDLPTIVISTNQGTDHEMIAREIQAQWQQAFDLDVVIEVRPWKEHLELVEAGDFMVGRISYVATYGDPAEFLQRYQVPDGPANPTGWDNAEYAEIVARARSTSHPGKRASLLLQAERLLMDEMPLIPIYHLSNNYIKRQNLHQVFITKLGHPEFKWSYRGVR